MEMKSSDACIIGIYIHVHLTHTCKRSKAHSGSKSFNNFHAHAFK